jgi:predicted GIY-YIG superfamily endonuclease
MHSDSEYFVYIMSNRSKTLYTGITNNLLRRVWEHKRKWDQNSANSTNWIGWSTSSASSTWTMQCFEGFNPHPV